MALSSGMAESLHLQQLIEELQTSMGTITFTSSTTWSGHTRTTTTNHHQRRCRPTTTILWAPTTSNYRWRRRRLGVRGGTTEHDTNPQDVGTTTCYYKGAWCGEDLLHRLERRRTTGLADYWKERHQTLRLEGYPHTCLSTPTSLRTTAASPQLRCELGCCGDVYYYCACQWTTTLACSQHLPACGTTAQRTTQLQKVRKQLHWAGQPLGLTTQHEWVHYTYSDHHRVNYNYIVQMLTPHYFKHHLVDTTVTHGDYYADVTSLQYWLNCSTGVLQVSGLRSSRTYYRRRLQLQRRQLVELLHLLQERCEDYYHLWVDNLALSWKWIFQFFDHFLAISDLTWTPVFWPMAFLTSHQPYQHQISPDSPTPAKKVGTFFSPPKQVCGNQQYK